MHTWAKSQTVMELSHCSIICSKANHLLGFLHRNLKISLMHIKEMAYKQLILTVLVIVLLHNMGPAPTSPYPQVRNGTTPGCMLCFKLTVEKKWPGQHHWVIAATKLVQFRNTTKNARLTLLFKVINSILIIPTEYLPPLLPSPELSIPSNLCNIKHS